MEQLPQDFQYLVPYVDRYGYLSVFVGLLLEDFGLPVPGETVLIVGAIFAGVLGKFSIWWVLLIGFLGAVLGDDVGYAIGRFAGHRLVHKYGRYVLITEKRLNKAEEFFERHGGKVVVVARFVELLRQLNGIAAGVSGMRWRHFLAYNALGATLWVGFWGVIGYFFGDKFGVISDKLGNWGFTIVFFLGPFLMVGLAVAYHFLYRRRKRDHS